MDISSVGFSKRTVNDLLRGGVTSMSQLEELTLDDLMKFKYMARKSIYEVETKLAEQGKSLKKY